MTEPQGGNSGVNMPVPLPIRKYDFFPRVHEEHQKVLEGRLREIRCKPIRTSSFPLAR